jgi:AcrR family transcriptional regulator
MSQPARTPRKRRSYHHGDLRRALLDEAVAMIHAEGVEAVTVREIGARLGVSRTALYRHFADKRALLEAVATEGFAALRERLASAWEGTGRGRAGFEAMGFAYVRFALDSPAHYRVMFGGFVDRKTRGAELAGEATAAFGTLVEALAALQRDGSARGDATLLMARYVWAVVHGVAMLAVAGQIPEAGGVEAMTRYAIERLQAAILVDAEGARS